MDERVELRVVYPRVPDAALLELVLPRQQYAAGVLMLGRDGVGDALAARRELLRDLLREEADLRMPRHVLHGQRGRVGFSAVCHSLDLNKIFPQ